MADEFYDDPEKDPGKNDSSMPSVTTPMEALRLADKRAGVPEAEAGIPAPADAIDLAYRTAVADVDAVEVGTAVAEAQKAGVEAEAIDVEALGEGEVAPEDAATSAAEEADTGSGPYEGRTLEQLRAAASARGLATSGSKAELAERLRG